MNSFIYDIPTKVYFGENQLGHLGEELSRYGKKVLLTYGGGSIKKSGLYDKVVAEIKKAGLELFELSGIEPNPKVSSVRAGAELCKKEGIEVLLAVGGGSVIDCTKFIGAATFYDGDAWDILEEKAEITRCLPILDVLTLAATGSEMDSVGVISNSETKDKICQGSPLMQPKVSFLDPTVTYTVSPVTGKPPVPLQTKNKRKRGTSCENSSFFVFRISTRPASLLARLFHLGNPLFAFFRKLLRPWKQVLQKIQIRIVHVFRNLGQ